MRILTIFVFIFLGSFHLSLSQNHFGTYTHTQGLCSENIYLWEDSTFQFEAGCEHRSRFTFGDFTIKNGRLTLNPKPLNEHQTFAEIQWVDSLENKEILFHESYFPCFVVVDRNENLIDIVDFGYYDKKGVYVAIGWKKSKFAGYPMYNDGGEIYFPQLCTIFRQFVEVKIPPNPEKKNILKIVLNCEGTFLWYSEFKYDLFDKPINNFIFNNDTLIKEFENGVLKFEKIK